MLVFIGSFILTIITAFIQTTNWIVLGDIIKPNLILVMLIVLGIINPSWIRRAILILTAALILKFTPSAALFDLIFVGASFISVVMMDVLPWQRLISLLAAVAAGTIIINLDHLILLPLVYELMLNLLLAFILFALPRLAHVSQIQLQRNKF